MAEKPEVTCLPRRGAVRGAERQPHRFLRRSKGQCEDQLRKVTETDCPPAAPQSAEYGHSVQSPTSDFGTCFFSW